MEEQLKDVLDWPLGSRQLEASCQEEVCVWDTCPCSGLALSCASRAAKVVCGD
jgi:hypothetical protein